MRSKSDMAARAAMAAEMDAYVAVFYDVGGARSDSKIDRTAMVEHLCDSGHAAWTQLVSYQTDSGRVVQVKQRGGGNLLIWAQRERNLPQL